MSNRAEKPEDRTDRRLAIGVVAAAVIAAVVLFIALSGSDDESAPATTTTTVPGQQSEIPGPAPAPAPQPPLVTAQIEFENGAPVGGVEEIEADKGDRLRIKVSSDEAGELHVHGYEITKQVQAGGSVVLAFKANLDGVYEIELHGDVSGEVQIGELKINP